jgi:hypothetical protein
MKENDIPLGVVRLVRNYATYTGLLGMVVAIWSWAGWGFPFVMAKDYRVDKGSIEKRLGSIEVAIGEISLGQLEAKELQLQARVQDLEREVAKARPGDPLQALLERQRSEALQALRRVEVELRSQRARQVPGADPDER